MTEKDPCKWQHIENEQAENLACGDDRAVPSSSKEVFFQPADEVAQAQMPFDGNSVLSDGDCRAETGKFNEFSEFHVVDYFHGEAPMRSQGFISGTFQDLERADARVGTGIGIADLIGVCGELEAHAKKRDQ